MIRSVNIVKNTRKYKYLFVKKIGLILIAMTAGFVFFVCIHGYVLWELRLLIAIKLCPWNLSADIFIQNMIRSYFICNQKCISTFDFFFVVGWSKVIKIRRHSICWEWNSNELCLVQLRIMTHQYACQIYHLLSYKNILKVYI